MLWTDRGMIEHVEVLEPKREAVIESLGLLQSYPSIGGLLVRVLPQTGRDVFVPLRELQLTEGRNAP